MNMNQEEGKILASEVTNMAKDELTNCDVQLILIPPFIHLNGVKGIVGDSSKVAVGAQNCSNMDKGAFTGEVSAQMLSSFDVNYVIIGHSERRSYYNESNEMLAEKVKQALANGLTPIFCCGEPLEIREAKTHVEYVTKQITESVFGLSADEFSKIVIAYEPIWAIGTGVTATSAQAQDMHADIRAHLASKYGQEIAESTSILYGGSCKPGNAKELFACKDVDGGLIGGASLKSRDFVDISKSF